MNIINLILAVAGAFAILFYIIVAILTCNHLLTILAEWIHKHYE